MHGTWRGRAACLHRRHAAGDLAPNVASPIFRVGRTVHASKRGARGASTREPDEGGHLGALFGPGGKEKCGISFWAHLDRHVDSERRRSGRSFGPGGGRLAIVRGNGLLLLGHVFFGCHAILTAAREVSSSRKRAPLLVQRYTSGRTRRAARSPSGLHPIYTRYSLTVSYS